VRIFPKSLFMLLAFGERVSIPANAPSLKTARITALISQRLLIFRDLSPSPDRKAICG
jgi:hypothetical protein